MARKPPLAALAAFLMVLALTAPLVAGPALAADGGEDAVTLPTSIPINTDESVSTYEQDGVVTGGVGAPQMEITIAEERDDVDLGYTLDPLESSTRNDFVRIEHKEDMGRTVRIPISADYWKPFPRDELESLDGDHTAKLEPVRMNGDTFTLLTVTFDGADSAVFAIPEDAVAVYSASERTEERMNSTLGVDLGITPSPWSEIPPTVFGNKTAVRIEGNPDDMMIQYNAGTASEAEWLSVPDEPKDGVPVYRMQKEGVDNAVYVVTRTTDTPAVRYKTQSTMGDRVSMYIREAKSLPSRIAEGIGVDLPDMGILTVSPQPVRWP